MQRRPAGLLSDSERDGQSLASLSSLQKEVEVEADKHIGFRLSATKSLRPAGGGEYYLHQPQRGAYRRASIPAYLLYHDIDRVVVLHVELCWRVIGSNLYSIIQEFDLSVPMGAVSKK